MRGVVKWLTGLAALGMFLVLVMGATVTNTGSGKGCGQSWPLCNGRFIPEFAVATAIEFSHRAVTGVESFLIFGASAALWWYGRRRWEARLLVPLMLFFLFLQAGLGAWAVLYPQTSEVLALHFGVSLLAFASTFLAWLFAVQANGPVDRLRDAPIPSRLRWAAWALLGYVYVVVYLGAYVRHTNSMLSCPDWPLCNGALVPNLSSGGVAIAFLHRLAAAGSVVAVAALVAWTHRLRDRRPDLYRAAGGALVLVVAQALSGALVIFTRVGLFSTLLHSGVMALLFGALSYLCLQVLPRPVVAREPAPHYAVSPSRVG